MHKAMYVVLSKIDKKVEIWKYGSMEAWMEGLKEETERKGRGINT